MQVITIIVVFAGIGALIDFWIGKVGQRKVRDWLEYKWILTSDVSVRNFGKREARLAASLLTNIFGTISSTRRLIISLIVLIVGLSINTLLPALRYRSFDELSIYENSFLILGSTVLTAVMFSLTISITVWVAEVAARKLPEKPAIMIAYFIAFLALQYLFALLAERITGAVLSVISVFSTYFFWLEDKNSQSLIPRVLRSIWDELSYTDTWTWLPYSNSNLLFDFQLDGFTATHSYTNFLSAAVNILRFVVAVIFILSFVFKPLQTVIMTFWARLVESDKPVFTLFFGGLGAFGKGIQELGKAILG